MKTLVAVNAIQLCYGDLEIVEFSKEGEPVYRMIRLLVEPGEQFQIEDDRAARLIEMGAATDDLGFTLPEAKNAL